MRATPEVAKNARPARYLPVVEVFSLRRKRRTYQRPLPQACSRARLVFGGRPEHDAHRRALLAQSAGGAPLDAVDVDGVSVRERVRE